MGHMAMYRGPSGKELKKWRTNPRPVSMTTYSNIVVSGVPLRAKLGGPEKGGESGPLGDIMRAQVAWLTGRQYHALPSNIRFGSTVTVRFPSINKDVLADVVNWSGDSVMLDFHRQLDLTENQARAVWAADQSPAVR